MRRFVFTALAAAVVACASAEERAEEAQARFRLALERGDRTEAIAAIEDLRASLPDTPESLLQVAQLQVRAGSAPDAGWLLEEGVRRFPERDELRLVLGRVALLLGNPALAREAVLPVASDSEHHPVALVVRAQADLGLGDLDRALETLAEAERLYPERPEARLVRIATLLGEHRREEALAAIDEARAALSTEDEAENEETLALRRHLDLTLAQIQAQQGEPDAALAILDAMVRASPEDLQAWRALVQVLAQQERIDDRTPRYFHRFS